MLEEVTIYEYKVHIRDVANEFVPLSVPMSDDKLVQMIMRSLPDRFTRKSLLYKKSMTSLK